MVSRLLVFTAIFFISTLMGCSSDQEQQATPNTSKPVATGGIIPQPIPDGFGFPGSREEIQAWANNWQIDKITVKAWDLWGGMTADTNQSWKDDNLPVWETWCGTDETFGKNCNILNRPSRQFINATQLSHTTTAGETHLRRLVAFN